jgi:hypothetical protein
MACKVLTGHLLSEWRNAVDDHGGSCLNMVDSQSYKSIYETLHVETSLFHSDLVMFQGAESLVVAVMELVSSC